MMDRRDERAVLGWFLHGFEDKEYIDHETGERSHPLGEVIADIRESIGIDISADAQFLLDYAAERQEHHERG